MFCPDCGHNNPSENRFCGMCGERLPDSRPRRSSETETSKLFGNSADNASRPTTRPAVEEATYVEERNTPEGSPAEPTTVGGLSFLGLSGETSSTGGYSYLFGEEEPKSHKGAIVFLILLIALGLAVYFNWQPIRGWVLNTALSHMRSEARPAAAPSATETPTGAPINNEASSSPPAIEQQPVNQNATPQQDKSDPNTNSAGSDKQPTGESKPPKDASPSEPSKAPKAQAQDNNDEASANDDGVRPSGTRRARTTDAVDRRRGDARPEGSQFVDSGEKYLYGRGVRRNCGQAVIYFRAAADMQNPRALSHLGALYATGECVPIDRALAYSYFVRARSADPTNPYLERNLNMLWRDMTPDERKRVAR